LNFTGEYFVPGKSGERIEADHMARYRFAAGHVRGFSVLDIACGVGYAASVLLEAGATSYLGVDIRPELVQHARYIYGTEQATFEVGDVCQFYQGQEYGVITCFETIEHVSDYRKALNNLFKLVQPGGLLLISSPNRPLISPGVRNLSDRPMNPFHTQEFTFQELTDELRYAGFEVGNGDVFGQRQRRSAPFRNRYLRAGVRLLVGNPDKGTSPEVTPVESKTPLYFVIRARRSLSGPPRKEGLKPG
jgi:SAM-dependent methyltransferase